MQQLGIIVLPVAPGAALTAGPPTLVIGRAALSHGNDPPAGLADFVRGGGRLLVCAQDPQWTPFALGLRTAPHLSRRVFRIDPRHPVVAGLDDDDLRDWRGESALVPAYPDFPGFEGYPSYGWHWGNRGGVSSCPIEKPHRTSWRPILESEFDLAYTPLMEMEFGRGRVTFCTLDLEDHAASDPAAARLAAQVLDYVLTAPITPKATRVAYLGDDRGARLLDDMGIVYTKFTAPGTDLQLLIVGANATPPAATVKAITARGGHVLYLMRQGAGPQPHGLVLEQRAEFHGALDAPEWPECAGLSASDLRWRADHEAWLIMASEAIESGADGQLGRMVSGTGSIIFCQIDPRWLPADEKTYFRFTRWRQMRALAQLLANLGATFTQDQRFMTLLQQPDHPVMLAGLWDVQLTDPQVESLKRAWNGDRGFSAAATALVQPDAATNGWEQKPVPAYMESYGPRWQWADGEAVFRKIVVLPARFKGKALELSIGRADQKDTTFFNGAKIGETDSWNEPRRYAVPANLVQGGTNVIAIRLFDAGIHGGLCDSPEKLYLRAQRAPDKFYHDDYLPDYTPKEFELGDNPYRYFRW
ncbi:MAG: hypothetical protein NTV22_04490 [bacterium]|nr:hypothetical protein [bacterium]